MKKNIIVYHGRTIYVAKLDRVFKALFISSGDLTLLASFLSSILNIPMKADDLIILNTEMASDNKDGKLSRLDIRIKTSDGKHIDLEIQLIDEHNMDKRSLFNLSKLYTQQLRSGEGYSKMGAAIAICILDFKYLPYEDVYHNIYRMANIRTGDILTDIFELNFIELPKVPPELNNNMKDLWMKFLSAKSEEELDMLAERSPVIKNAVRKLVTISADERLRYEMDMQERAELDYISAMEEVREAKALRAAERALKRGGEPQDIAYDLELPLSMVLEIKEKIS
jgi:predicted transposase/invertase (TIGR01784 family)